MYVENFTKLVKKRNKVRLPPTQGYFKTKLIFFNHPEIKLNEASV